MADKAIQVESVIKQSFSDVPVPVFKKVSNKKHVPFGQDDNYPAKLLYLYNKSAKHNAIINGKVKYIFGGGIECTNEEDAAAKAWAASVNRRGETLGEIIKPAALDVELFGGFYFEVIPNAIGNSFELFHIPFSCMRTNERRTEFFYKKSWAIGDREKPKEYPAFEFNLKAPSIFFFGEYRPDVAPYCLPGYTGAINYIESDVETSKWMLTKAQKGFSPTKMVSIIGPEPTPEEKKKISKQFKFDNNGSEGETTLIAYPQTLDKKPIIDDLGASDLTKENFTPTDNLISSNIYAGHEITSPILFGIKEAGQLGGTSELKNSYEIFKNTYANNKQQQLEKIINKFAQLRGIASPFEFVPIDPIGFDITGEMISEALSKGEIRERLGLDEEQPTAGNEALARAINSLSPLVANKVMEKMTDNEVRSLAGLLAKPEGETIPGATGSGPVQPAEQAMVNEHLKNLTGKQHQNLMRIVRQFAQGKLNREQAMLMIRASFGMPDADILSLLGIAENGEEFSGVYSEDDAAEMFSEVGEGRETFEVIESKPVNFQSNKDVEDYEHTYFEAFAEEAKEKSVTEKVIRNLPKISIKYSYEVRPGAGAEIIATTRPFCEKLIKLDRLYTRQEIELISERLGYSVWDRRGGFWGDKPYCRHIWKSNLVMKKA